MGSMNSGLGLDRRRHDAHYHLEKAEANQIQEHLAGLEAMLDVWVKD